MAEAQLNSDETEMLKRAEERRRRIVVHRSRSFAEADQWDLEYWQAMSPEERLDAFVALREDVALIQRARKADGISDR